MLSKNDSPKILALKENPKILAILGMGRSGTTMLTRSLYKIGTWVGKKGAYNDNWEHYGFRGINDELMEKLFGAKMGVLPYGVIRELGKGEIPQRYYDSADKICQEERIACRENGFPYFVVKTPRSTILYDLWERNFDIVVGIVRRPQEVINSYIYYKFVSVDNAHEVVMTYWKEYNKRLLKIMQASDKEKYLLDFHGLVDEQFSALADRLGFGRLHSEYDFGRRRNKDDGEINDKEAKEIYLALREYRI